jgi:Ca2+-binding EF-hand superfamily protein
MGKDEHAPQKGDPTGTIRFADFSRQVFGPDLVIQGKKSKKLNPKLRRGASGADFRDASEMSPEKRQFNATLRRSDANMRRVFATMNSFEELEKIIQNKLFERTGSGGMELLRLFRQIDKDKNMCIDIDEFKEALVRFNINLEQQDIRRLFNHYDKSGSGAISYYDFIKHLLPGDFIPLEKLKSMGGIPGMSKRDFQREVLDAAAARAVNNAKRGSVGLGSDRQIEKILRDKIMTNLSSGPYELVRMFRMFDLDGNGSIDYHEFKEVFGKFNIVIPDSQLKTLFQHYDKSGCGAISYYDFLHHVLPADFPDTDTKAPETGFATMGADSRTNNVALRNPHFARAEKRATKYVKNAFKGHGDFQMLEKILRQKIVEKTKSGGAELLRLFRQFDKDGNQAIDREEFKATLKIYNLDLEDDDLDMMFNRYDQDKDGLINYYEFIQHLLPDDFIPLEKLKSMGGLPGMTSTDHSKMMLSRAAKVAERNAQRGQAGLAIHDKKFVRRLLKDKVMMKTKGGARELWNAFRHFDKDGSGDIDFDEFYHVVVRYYNIDLPRSEVQAMFQEFLDRRVYSKEGKNNESMKKQIDSSIKNNAELKSETIKSVGDPNVQTGSTQAWEGEFKTTVEPPKNEHPKLRRIVKRKWRHMLRDFSSIDTVDSGYASRAETRYVLGKYNVSLSDQHLTSLIPTNRNGLIEYRKFLISFGKLRTVDAITFSYLILFLHYLANSY